MLDNMPKRLRPFLPYNLNAFYGRCGCIVVEHLHTDAEVPGSIPSLGIDWNFFSSHLVDPSLATCVSLSAVLSFSIVGFLSLPSCEACLVYIYPSSCLSLSPLESLAS